MPRKIETPEEYVARLKREGAEKYRKAGKVEKAIAGKARAEDTRRKVLAGSWALAKAADNPEFMERMRRELDQLWLVRDDDRLLFGYPLLSEEEQLRHPNYEKTRRGGRKPQGDRAGDSPPAPLREAEIEAA